MRKLTNDEIYKNNVDTLAQFMVLEYLKKNLSIYDFKVYLYDKNTIKVIDKNFETGYFEYNNKTKNIVFTETKNKNKDYEL